jgi:hypothetical protein
METEMDTNWQHQKKAITTDQKNLTDDEHIHELDKKELKTSMKTARPVQPKRESGDEDSGEGVGLGGKRE